MKPDTSKPKIASHRMYPADDHTFRKLIKASGLPSALWWKRALAKLKGGTR